MTEPADRPAIAGPEGTRGSAPRGGDGPRGHAAPARSAQSGPQRAGGPDRRSAEPLHRPGANELRQIIEEGNASVTDREALLIGRGLAIHGLQLAQMRAIFSEVRRIQFAWPTAGGDDRAKQAARDLILLKPRLAYVSGRASAAGPAGRIVSDFEQVLRPVIDLIGEDRIRFGHFVEFFDAIAAYYYASARPALTGR